VAQVSSSNVGLPRSLSRFGGRPRGNGNAGIAVVSLADTHAVRMR